MATPSSGHSPAYPAQTGPLCWLGSAHGDKDETRNCARSCQKLAVALMTPIDCFMAIFVGVCIGLAVLAYVVQ
jgi:hypothetical protein